MLISYCQAINNFVKKGRMKKKEVNHKIKFLVINQIITDGDFSYDKEKIHAKVCNNRNEVFLFILEIMQSLTQIETSPARDYLKEPLEKLAKEWIKYYQNGIELIPNIDYGNQKIIFSVNVFKENEFVFKEEQEECNREFDFISYMELTELNPDEYREFETLSDQLNSDEDFAILNQMQSKRYAEDGEYCGTLKDDLNDIRLIIENKKKL